MSDFKFEGFEPSNVTLVPDVLFDELLPELSGAELKVLLYVIRRTLGFKKATDAISFNQFLSGIITKNGKVLDKGCGVKDKTTLSRALASLEKMGCFTSQKGTDPQGDKATTLYSIRFKQGVVGKSYHPVPLGSREIIPPVVGKTDHRSMETIPGVVGKSYQQDTDKQDTDKQDTDKQDTDKQESTLPTVSQPLTSHSSSDSCTHTLSSVSSSQLESQLESSNHDTHDSPLTALQHPALSSTAALVSGRNDASHQEMQPAVAEGTAAESRIASTTAQAEPAKEKTPRKRAPRKPKTLLLDLDEETRARVVKVLDCLDSWRQETSGNPDQCYSREDPQAIAAIVKILPLKPTPKRLRQVCDSMWNTPRDSRTGFHWQKHMTVVNICKQYDTQSLELDAKEKKATQYTTISILPVTPIKDDDDDLVYIGPQSRRQKRRGA